MAATSPELYETLKIALMCVECRKRPAADDSSRCVRHRDQQRKRQRKATRVSRALRRDQGLCAFCPLPSVSYRCPACYARAGLGKRKSVDVSVDKQNRIAATTRVHDDGRIRYHGQAKRGSQPAGQLDDQDWGSASKLFNAGMTRLGLYRGPEVQAMPRIQRESVRRQATQELDLGMRFVEEIQERNGHFKTRPGRRDGDK